MEWAQILVIILSVFLALFLIVGIILIIMLIKVTNQIKRVTGSAERTAVSIEKIVGKASSMASFSAIAGLITKQLSKTRKK